MRKLVLGNLNYSSWSIRPLLVARKLGLGIYEEVVPLDTPEGKARFAEISPTRKVPVLLWDGAVVWDSLAIIEFLAEQAQPGSVWPTDPIARAVARSAAAEMHSGFPALRKELPMDIRARIDRPALSPAAEADIARVQALWRETRTRFGGEGPYLFGAWSAADAMYAPVATRFQTYGIALEPDAQSYVDAALAYPVMQALAKEAADEPWEIVSTPDGLVGRKRA